MMLSCNLQALQPRVHLIGVLEGFLATDCSLGDGKAILGQVIPEVNIVPAVPPTRLRPKPCKLELAWDVS